VVSSILWSKKLIKRRVNFALILLVFLLSATGCREPAAQRKTSLNVNPLVITNGTIIDGTGSDPIQDGIVVIQDDRIKFVGPASDYAIPPEAEVIDAQGGTILPGFIDSHVHSTSDTAVRRDFLIDGVTAVCDLGSPLSEISQFEVDHRGQDAVSHGFQAGPILTAPGGMPDAVLHGNLNYEVATPEEAREAVKDLLGQGADFVKVYIHQERGGTVYPMLGEEELGAIVQEAHARGVLVRAHVTYIDLLDMAIEAGVDVIEHVPINSSQSDPQSGDEEQRKIFFGSDDPLQMFFDFVEPEYEAQLDRMAAEEIVMVPTLDRPFGDLFRMSNPTLEQKVIMDIILGIVRRFHEFGGMVGLGTDFNVGIGIEAGMPMGEFEMLLAAGLAPLEVIEAGTRNAAIACGQDDELGTLEVGKLADVIVVDGDPLEDIQSMARVFLVIKQGEVAYAAEP
jgi:imidazolonepropionase-like amidohydrolase